MQRENKTNPSGKQKNPKTKQQKKPVFPLKHSSFAGSTETDTRAQPAMLNVNEGKLSQRKSKISTVTGLSRQQCPWSSFYPDGTAPTVGQLPLLVPSYSFSMRTLNFHPVCVFLRISSCKILHTVCVSCDSKCLSTI